MRWRTCMAPAGDDTPAPRGASHRDANARPAALSGVTLLVGGARAEAIGALACRPALRTGGARAAGASDARLSAAALAVGRAIRADSVDAREPRLPRRAEVPHVAVVEGGARPARAVDAQLACRTPFGAGASLGVAVGTDGRADAAGADFAGRAVGIHGASALEPGVVRGALRGGTALTARCAGDARSADANLAGLALDVRGAVRAAAVARGTRLVRLAHVETVGRAVVPDAALGVCRASIR